MRDFTHRLSLPVSLVAFVFGYGVAASNEEWPYNLPRSVKYFPEHESHMRRGLEAQERLLREAPTAIKKMGDDAGEKFLLDYWQWDVVEGEDSLGSFGVETKQQPNRSLTVNLLPALMPHIENSGRRWGLLGRSIFARNFQCPAGTKSCSSIDSSLCCDESDSCVQTREGPGCCPSGATCGDDVAECDTDAGYSSCPEGGGCCLPGAKCLDTGCIYYGTEVVTATSTRTTTARPSTSNAPSAAPTTITSGYTTTATVTISGEGRTETTTIISPTTIIILPSAASSCTSSFFSCAASLGGGCCRDGQDCATDSCVDRTTTSTVTAAPPVRPTTSGASVSAADTEMTTTLASSSSPAAGCPTGFYMCSAVYLGGCCRVDRNCDTTSCPSSATSAVVTGTGVSVGVLVNPTSGSCANGWFSCAANNGGGCCPTGYSCGASCIATVSGAGDTGKMAPESAAVVEKAMKFGFLSIAAFAGLGMVLL